MTLFDVKLLELVNMKIWHNTSKVVYGEFMFVPIKDYALLQGEITAEKWSFKSHLLQKKP